MEFIQTENAPTPAGHYSQGTIANGMIYVSGQLPVEPGKTKNPDLPIADQAKQALRNVLAIIQAGGGAIETVVKVQIYISDVALWGAVNETYATFFGAHKPARVIIPTKDLHYGFKIEIDAIAMVK